MSNLPVQLEAQDVPVMEEFRHVDPEYYDFEVCDTFIDAIGPYKRIDVYCALVKTYGNLSAAAKLLGRTRDSLKRWIQARPDFTALMEDIQEGIIDECEDVVREKVQTDRDGAMARFVLQTRGKNRGYTTRVEGGAGADLGSLIAARITDEQLVNIAKELVERNQGNMIDVTPE